MKSAFLLCVAVVLPTMSFGQWSAQINISPRALSASLNEDAGPCLAVSGDTIHVVWSDRRTKGAAVYYRRSIDTGKTWNTEIALTDTTAHTAFPAIAVSGEMVHVVWLDTLRNNPASYYRRSTDGGNTWGPTVLLDSITKFWPGIAVSGSTVYATLNKGITSTNTEVILMRSTDNGTTWGPEMQLSNADGRSEDPAIAVQGADVHLSWNDNRNNKLMEIYYRHSSDWGVTWGPETALTTTNSYTSMVCLNKNFVDVPCGKRNASGNFAVFLESSTNTGGTWVPDQQLTADSSTRAYPYEVRDGNNIFMACAQIGTGGGPWYNCSTDGGATWSVAQKMGNGVQPFLALTGSVLHLIWPDSGKIYYRRNSTANPTPVAGVNTATDIVPHGVSIITNRPNPFTSATTIEYTLHQSASSSIMGIYNSLGEQVAEFVNGAQSAGIHSIQFNGNQLKSGIYWCRLVAGGSVVLGEMMVVK